MRRYAIWQYIPDEAKQAALHQSYRHGRTEDGYCPLGVALSVALVPGLPITSKAPGSLAVADALKFIGCKRPHSQLRISAARFIREWDGNLIRPQQLRETMGLEAPK